MELPTPITIYWDLPGEPTSTEELLKVAADIMACRPLMLHLLDTAPAFRAEIAAVAACFKGSPVAVSLTMTPTAFAQARTILPDAGLQELLVTVRGVGDIPKPLAPATALSCAVTADNWRQLPELVAHCRNNGIRRLMLPMQRLYESCRPFFLSPREQEELAFSLAQAGGHDGLNLTIHDPFLWQAFNPGIPFPQGGCQAANTMIAVAGTGGVYPCPSLPVRLGSLSEQSLKEVLASPAKKDFRRKLLESPADCRSCADVSSCKGGCRGRGYVSCGNLEGIDPACR